MAESLEEQGDTEVKIKEDVTDVPPPPAELQMVKEQGLMSRRGM